MSGVWSAPSVLTHIVKLQVTLSEIDRLRRWKEVYAPLLQIFTAQKRFNIILLFFFTKYTEKKNKFQQFFIIKESPKATLVHSPKLGGQWARPFTLLHLNIGLLEIRVRTHDMHLTHIRRRCLTTELKFGEHISTKYMAERFLKDS